MQRLAGLQIIRQIPYRTQAQGQQGVRELSPPQKYKNNLDLMKCRKTCQEYC